MKFTKGLIFASALVGAAISLTDLASAQIVALGPATLRAVVSALRKPGQPNWKACSEPGARTAR
jgi:hypothetical protein